MDRFLQVQIWNSSNTAIEYDNKVDDFWGINSGTAILDQILMQDELHYGETNSAMFEVQVFGLDKTIKLNGRFIKVTLDYEYSSVDDELLVNEEDDFVVDSNGNFIVGTPETISVSEPLFYGVINSSESDILKTDRDIIAYDLMYTIRGIDILDWWNDWWWNKIGRANYATISELRTALLEYLDEELGIESSTEEYQSFCNDSIHITCGWGIKILHVYPRVTSIETKYPLESLTLGEALHYICELQNVTPYMDGNGVLRFKSLGLDTHDLRGKTEGLNSTWKDYEVSEIKNVAFYNSSTEFITSTGNDTSLNTYNVVGNVLLLGKAYSEMASVIGMNLLFDGGHKADGELIDGLWDFNAYVPATVKMKVSRPNYKLGEKLITDGGTVYMMQNTLSGSLLVEQTIQAVALEEDLSTDITTQYDVQINTRRVANLSNSIHAGIIEVTFSDGSASVSYDAINVTSRPDGLVLTPTGTSAIFLTYNYDASISNIAILAKNSNGSNYTGTLNISYICIT